MKVHVNTFVTRQTPESEFSHFEGTWQELEDLVSQFFWLNQTQGYREGVVLVNMPEHLVSRFFSGVVTLSEGTELRGSFKARRPGETPRKSMGAVGASKLRAKSVQVVLYSSAVLAEGGDNELTPEAGHWEIISINANPCEGEMPISPMVLLHNHFGSDGGTDTNLSDTELVAMLRESFLFWKDKAMVCPE